MKDFLSKAKKKQASFLVGAIMLILGVLNIAITPEQYELVEYGVDAFILAGGVAYIKKLVASEETFEKHTDPLTTNIVFKRRG